MKVKILEVYEFNCHREDYDTSYSDADATNWDEVTEEEYDILKQWVTASNSDYKRNIKYVIVKEANISIPKTVKAFLARATKEQKEREESAKKAKETAEKRQKTIEAKRASKEKKLLEELKNKYDKPNT